MKNTFTKSLLIALSVFFFMGNCSFASVNVERISGSDRYQTALKVNQKFLNKADGNLAVFTSGTDFNTALYGSYLASSLKVPYYVVSKNGISKDILSEIDRLKIKRAYVVAGYELLNKKIDDALTAKGVRVERLFDSKHIDGSGDNLYNHIDYILLNTFLDPQNYRGGLEYAIVINDEKFPDLLSSIPYVSSLARKYNMGLFPYYIFPTFEGQLYGAIIGGYDTVPSYFDANTKGEDGKIIEVRVSGKDRYETAVKIAEAYKEDIGIDIKTVILVNGADFPDALSSGIAAVFTNATVLLTNPNKLNSYTKEYLLKNNITKVVIVGGENSVSASVENELKSLK